MTQFRFAPMFAAAALLLPAVGVSSPVSTAVQLDKFLSQHSRSLTAEEQRNLDLARRYDSPSHAAPPTYGPDGSVRFVFGAQRPTIICAVLQLCDIALQAGEIVRNLEAGDRVRWQITPSISGDGLGAQMHVMVKPTDVALETALVVTTNRRTYHLKLVSTRDQYMPAVSFIYQDDETTRWNELRQQAEEIQAQALADLAKKPDGRSNEYLGDLRFDYYIHGNAPWRPTRVYNDGKKTIIEMPTAMQRTEAPTLLVIRGEPTIFRKEETVMVNYRVQGSRYIVDTVFDKAMLIAGVGSRQERVDLVRKK